MRKILMAAAIVSMTATLAAPSARADMVGKFTSVEAFVEEAAGIAEHFRLDDLDFGKRGSGYLDGHAT